MNNDAIKIISYTLADRKDLLVLLLELHSNYFLENASKNIQELQAEPDIKKSYSDYLATIEREDDGRWQTLLAKTDAGRVIGFIMGSIETDNYLVLEKKGKIEDWFVTKEYRGQGIGAKLYTEIEKWFRQKGCQQVVSDTWDGNGLSIKAHQSLGFFISGVIFGKKL